MFPKIKSQILTHPSSARFIYLDGRLHSSSNPQTGAMGAYILYRKRSTVQILAQS